MELIYEIGVAPKFSSYTPFRISFTITPMGPIHFSRFLTHINWGPYNPFSHPRIFPMTLTTQRSSVKIFCRDLRNSFFTFSARLSGEVSSGASLSSRPLLPPRSTSPSVFTSREATHICFRTECPRSEITFFVASERFLIGHAMRRMILERRYGPGLTRSESCSSIS